MDLLEKDLRDLGRVRAPAGFAERVLVAAGIVPGGADLYADLETVIGVLHVAWNGDGLSALRRASEGDDFARWFAQRLGRSVVRVAAPPDRLAGQVAEAIAGRSGRVRFDLAGLSPFEQEVLRKTLEIPRGEVRPYAWVAREIGRPRAVRAVGTALATNPIPVLIPCHRVVRSDGVIGNYGAGGPVAKRKILDAEGVGVSRLEELAARGVRFLGSETTHIFCMPTCYHRVTDRHLVTFRSEQEARGRGYRPCKDCRPAGATAA